MRITTKVGPAGGQRRAGQVGAARRVDARRAPGGQQVGPGRQG
ncbi:hypothetical protein [Actinosynnema pretiosum]|nr:hypothetical protein [Actinosynnema pretiosum]